MTFGKRVTGTRVRASGVSVSSPSSPMSIDEIGQRGRALSTIRRPTRKSWTRTRPRQRATSRARSHARSAGYTFPMIVLRLTCSSFWVDVRLRELNGRWIASADTPDAPSPRDGQRQSKPSRMPSSRLRGSWRNYWRAYPGPGSSRAPPSRVDPPGGAAPACMSKSRKLFKSGKRATTWMRKTMAACSSGTRRTWSTGASLRSGSQHCLGCERSAKCSAGVLWPKVPGYRSADCAML